MPFLSSPGKTCGEGAGEEQHLPRCPDTCLMDLNIS